MYNNAEEVQGYLWQDPFFAHTSPAFWNLMWYSDTGPISLDSLLLLCARIIGIFIFLFFLARTDIEYSLVSMYVTAFPSTAL